MSPFASPFVVFALPLPHLAGGAFLCRRKAFADVLPYLPHCPTFFANLAGLGRPLPNPSFL